MNSPASTFWLLLLLYLPLSLSSQKKLTLSQDKKVEVFYDKTPVSGEIRVGIVDNIADEEIDQLSLYTHLPDIDLTQKWLCAHVSSRDGRYKAVLPYELDNSDRNQFVELPWESKKPLKVKHFRKNEVTVISKVANSCIDNVIEYTLTQWQKNESDTTYILLNAEKKPAIAISDGTTIKCKKIKDKNNVTYNYVCPVQTKTLANNTVTVRQRVKRLSGFTFKSYDLPIHISKK